MRIGSALTFLVATWIGLGYLLSDNMNAHQALAHVEQQAEQAIKDKQTIQVQLNNSNIQLNTLQRHNDELIQQNILLQEQVKQFQGENHGLKEQNAKLQARLNTINKLNSLIGTALGTFPQSPMLAILIPIIPMSWVAGLLVHKYGRRVRKPDQDNKPKRIVTINVTAEEMQQIAKLRRR